jgi:ATP-dependent RNA helicase DeaD
LSEAVLQALQAVGYEAPSPIQAATIPHLLAGTDVVGQAQTGTGKTAAFALPILSRIDMHQKPPQALVLAPTRELAIQVAEAFQRYASHMKGFHVLPIYGGQSYIPQLQSLKRGVHVIVGTPGRIMDHMKRGTLDLSALKFVVLDEADEMLQMGFIDDVNWILEQTPTSRIVALFSATMPPAIRRIAQTHLKSPTEVTIKSKTTTATNIRQRYWVVGGLHKLDALTRILESEPFDGMLVFARTKQATVDVAERLQARGFAVEPLNGDIAQAHRERTIARLKSGQIDIVVATDVAARGLDVERVSHVVNYDVPYDSESYVHRIGRTGRAGRSGEAILFLSPRERNMLRVIERATRQPITPMEMPTVADVNEQRITRFKQRITETLAAEGLTEFRNIVEQYEKEHNVPALEIAAALASMAQGKAPLQLTDSRPRDSKAERPAPGFAAMSGEEERPRRAREERPRKEFAPREFTPRDASARSGPRREDAQQNSRDEAQPRFREERKEHNDEDKETYRIEVGHVHGVKPGNIVGAIANEAGIEGSDIGRVDIQEDHSFVDLPTGMPKEVFLHLQKVRVAGQMLQIGRARRAHKVNPTREPRAAEGAPKRFDSAPKRFDAATKKFAAKRPTLGTRPAKPGPSGKPEKRKHKSGARY